MSRKTDRLKNMMEANKGLLNEDHEQSDEGKMEYIKGVLKNLNSNDLDKIYLSVEKYDPEYGHKPRSFSGDIPWADRNSPQYNPYAKN